MRPRRYCAAGPSGLYCNLGDFHIDPTRPVEKAVITHATATMRERATAPWLATRETLDIMRLRLGVSSPARPSRSPYGESVTLDGATLTFHPAGHVLGSAQVMIEAGGLRIVASGDYKNAADPPCAPFEALPCDVFITEATFGLPVFRHGDPDAEIRKLLHSVELFRERTHLIGAYALGKAQRLIALLRNAGYVEPIYLHGAMENITRYYQGRGMELGRIELAREAGKLPGAIVVCPPSALKSRVVAPLRGTCDRSCLGVHAGARPRAPTSR